MDGKDAQEKKCSASLAIRETPVIDDQPSFQFLLVESKIDNINTLYFHYCGYVNIVHYSDSKVSVFYFTFFVICLHQVTKIIYLPKHIPSMVRDVI